MSAEPSRTGHDREVDAHTTIEMIRERLTERAYLFEDRNAYEGGVEDALREVEADLVEDEPTG